MVDHHFIMKYHCHWIEQPKFSSQRQSNSSSKPISGYLWYTPIPVPQIVGRHFWSLFWNKVKAYDFKRKLQGRSLCSINIKSIINIDRNSTLISKVLNENVTFVRFFFSWETVSHGNENWKHVNLWTDLWQSPSGLHIFHTFLGVIQMPVSGCRYIPGIFARIQIFLRVIRDGNYWPSAGPGQVKVVVDKFNNIFGTFAYFD